MNLDRPQRESIMKFKIRDAKPEPEEPTLELWLSAGSEGVTLHAKLDDGMSYNVLSLDDTGIYRYSGCDDNLGLPTDPAGRVKDTTP